MNFTVTEGQATTWRHWGEIFGYPKCCIDWFCSRTSSALDSNQFKALDNHGFIPCPECAKKVTPETLDTLIENRTSPYPYPNDAQ